MISWTFKYWMYNYTNLIFNIQTIDVLVKEDGPELEKDSKTEYVKEGKSKN